MIEFKQFYMRHGVRRYETFTQAPLSPLVKFGLPWHSLVHYIPENSVEYGPDLVNIIFQGANGQKFIDHVIELATMEGTPISNRLIPATMIRHYRKNHRGIRPLARLENVVRDKKALVIENYSLLGHLWRYRPTFMTHYYKWKNVRTTLWGTAERIYRQAPEQNQFLFIQLPQQVPAYQDFRIASTRVTRDTLQKFNSEAALDLLDIFTWLGPDRERSILSAMSTEALTKMNIVVQESGYWVVINLGMLNQWVKGEGLGDEATIAKGKDPNLIQKAFMTFILRVLAARSVAAPTSEVRVTPDSPTVSIDTPVVSPDVTPPNVVLPPANPPSIVLSSKPIAELGIRVPTLPDAALGDVELDTNIGGGTRQSLPIILKPLEEDDSIVKAFWDFDQPPGNLDDILAPVEAATNIPRASDELARYDLGVLDAAARYHESGDLTAPEFRRFEKLASKYREIKVDETGRTLADLCVIDPKVVKGVVATKIPDIPSVLDKGMLKTTLSDFDRTYIRDVMESDTANMIMSVQKAEIAVTGFQRDRYEDVANKYDTYTIALTPVAGARSVIRFRKPVVEEDGTYMVNGTKYYLKKQRVDLPIRKVAPNKVALTSYYGKTFISRSEKSANNYAKWVTDQIAAGAMSKDSRFEQIHEGVGVDETILVPRIYSILASRFLSFRCGKYRFALKYKDLEQNFGPEWGERRSRNGILPIGWVTIEGKSVPMLVDELNMFYRGDTDEPLGTIEDLLEFPLEKAKVEIAELKVFSKNIPMGIILAYHYGIDKLLELLGVEPIRVAVGDRLNLAPDEIALRFADQSLIINRNNRLALLILGGFTSYTQEISRYDYEDFNAKPVYINLLEAKGMGARYLREVDLQFLMFIDHITRELLVDMHEPTEYGPLLVRACQLLLTDQCPDETDMNYMRLRGYERITGAIYRQLVLSLRQQRARPAAQRGAIEMHPEAVWRGIQEDGSSQQTEEANPIHNLKEQEAVTFGGSGGRGFRSMVRSSRVFHPTDLGSISEATVDSSSVAINTSLVANPKFTSLRGITARFDPKVDGASSLLSTSAVLAPASQFDDPKRVNFISIQHSSGIGAKGYQTMPLGTGYESVIAHRTSDLFAHAARSKGKVVEVNSDALVIEYDDPSLPRDYVKLGLEHGLVAGMTVPHNVITRFSVGDTVEEGDIVSYNTAFFTPDPLNPGQVLYKFGVFARTLLLDSTDTLEDSSAISQWLSEGLATEITKPRTLVLNFDQVVHNLVKVGQRVDLETILCNIEDPLTANAGLFDDDSYEALRVLAAQSPKAKAAGIVDKIEVLYNGDPEDMTESLAAITQLSDRERARKAKRLGGNGARTGRVSEVLRVDGTALEPGQIAIQIFITGEVNAGVGDKGVFANQLKTTFGRVMTGVNETEDGKAIDAIFGYQSVSDRIVLSPEIMGTTNTILDEMRLQLVDVYRGK